MSRLQSLQSAGVSIWLDTLSRELLESGAFARLVAESAVTGATSNPTIFANAITGSDSYDQQLHELTDKTGVDLREAFFALALDDVRRAAQLLHAVYEGSEGRDGFVSFECTPDLAHDTDGTDVRVAYQLYLRSFAGERWEALRRGGARPQRPLWASTGTKDPTYRDVVYVDELIGPDVVNTMPEATLRAFADHGRVARTVDVDPSEAERTLARAAAAGVDLAHITAELEDEGVQAFCASYRQLLDCIQSKLPRIGHEPLDVETPAALTAASPSAAWDPERPR